ncbi:hypothetical protein, partial [Nonomuraea aridisoli]
MDGLKVTVTFPGPDRAVTAPGGDGAPGDGVGRRLGVRAGVRVGVWLGSACLVWAGRVVVTVSTGP